jgi:hypothetical protein
MQLSNTSVPEQQNQKPTPHPIKEPITNWLASKELQTDMPPRSVCVNAETKGEL